jgi:hypothetical protein
MNTAQRFDLLRAFDWHLDQQVPPDFGSSVMV